MEQRRVGKVKNKARASEIDCMEICPRTGDIAALQQAYDDLKPHVTELITVNMTSVRAIMQANQEAIMEQFKGITYRQDIANGRTKKLEDKMDDVDKEFGVVRKDIDVVVRNQKVVRWIQEHPLKAVASGLLIGFVFAYAASILSLEQIIQWVK